MAEDETVGGRRWRQVQEGDAVLLGVDADTATASVEAVLALSTAAAGVAVNGALAAARWGSTIDEALVELAGGRRLRGAASDYELRQAREEAESDLEAALRSLSERASSAQSEAEVTISADRPLVDAVAAARAGSLTWVVAPGAAPMPRQEIERLAAAVGARLVD